MLRRVLTFILMALPALGAPSTSTAAGRLQLQTEERARTEVTDLLRTLCPEQCVLLGVEAQVDEESSGQGDPGFEAHSPAAQLPVVRSLEVRLLLDQQLPTAFRTRMRTLAAQRLKGLGEEQKVHLEAVQFPPRNAPHLEAPEAPTAQPPPAPAERPSPSTLPEAERRADSTAWSRLSESAPVLAVVVLLAVTLLGVSALLLLAVRKAQAPDLGYADWSGSDAPAEGKDKAATSFSEERERRLVKALTEERATRNAVLRDALAANETSLVARWVRELGDFMLEDLRGSPTLTPLAGELSRSSGTTDVAARLTALHELEGRLLARRLARSTESVDSAFSFLEGVRPERFRRAAQLLGPKALEVALRYAPSSLRAVALEDLSLARREELALSAVSQRDVNATYALSVAEELRERLETTAGGGAAEQLLSELVDGLPMEEQDRLVQRLLREGDAQVVKSLVTESTLLGASPEVLGAASLAIAPAELATYLAQAPVEVKDRLLAACPTRLAREMREELSLSAGVRREDFLNARRALLGRVRDELSRRGMSATDVKSNRIERPKLVSADS